MSIEINKPQRIAKVIARAGVCSRREAERWIADGRVIINDKIIETPATLVESTDIIKIDGEILPQKEETRLWIFHKPRGVVTTHFDPEGRETLFDILPRDLPDHIISIGRLDLMSEGLILLTNDGEFARALEHPSNNIPRTYHVRVYGDMNPDGLKQMEKGISIDGVDYGAIKWSFGSKKGHNQWIEMILTEGKNREIRKIIDHIGGRVNRLIRVSYGTAQLKDLSIADIREISPEPFKPFLKTISVPNTEIS